MHDTFQHGYSCRLMAMMQVVAMRSSLGRCFARRVVTGHRFMPACWLVRVARRGIACRALLTGVLDWGVPGLRIADGRLLIRSGILLVLWFLLIHDNLSGSHVPTGLQGLGTLTLILLERGVCALSNREYDLLSDRHHAGNLFLVILPLLAIV
jgi:hypothetical protein